MPYEEPATGPHWWGSLLANVWCASTSIGGSAAGDVSGQQRSLVILRMGVDIAVRAPHQASLTDERGQLLSSGHRFRTTATDLDALYEWPSNESGQNRIIRTAALLSRWCPAGESIWGIRVPTH
jgi:hypothetical protein